VNLSTSFFRGVPIIAFALGGHVQCIRFILFFVFFEYGVEGERAREMVNVNVNVNVIVIVRRNVIISEYEMNNQM
jgi:hypothetical protein